MFASFIHGTQQSLDYEIMLQLTKAHEAEDAELKLRTKLHKHQLWHMIPQNIITAL